MCGRSQHLAFAEREFSNGLDPPKISLQIPRGHTPCLFIDKAFEMGVPGLHSGQAETTLLQRLIELGRELLRSVAGNNNVDGNLRVPGHSPVGSA